MEEPLLTNLEDKNVMKSPLKEPIGPPPSKKLKQARLPFAPKQANSPPAPIAAKKRKLSDGSKNDKQPSKQTKSDENSEKEIIEIEDNEVSSSSEAEHAKNIHGKQEKPKKTIKDMLIGCAQQSVVSTSSASPDPKSVKVDDPYEEVIVLDNEEEQDKVNSKCDKSINQHPDECEEGKDNDDSDNDSKVSDTSSDDGAKNTESDEIDDKENVSLLSTAGEESLMEVSCLEDEDSGTEADTSLMEGNDAGSSSADKAGKGLSTPSSSTKPEKAVVSEKKKAEREAARQRKKEQLEKEKAEKIAEKLKQKEERKKQKQEEKEKKEQEKQAIKEKKIKERQEKMKEKEKEKEEKNRMKEEEKKKKMEAIEAKMEEKKKKEEEKKKKEEEKKIAEEEELMKKQKVKQAFVSFFKKVDKPAAQPKSQQKTNGIFMEFEPKKDMRLAPVVRHSLQDVDKISLDKELQDQTCKNLYVEQLKNKELKPGGGGKTWPWDEDDDDLEVIDEESSDEPAKPKHLMKAKFLYFHENYRPPYYGTWRKKSEKIRPRNPLSKDSGLLDYEVDSDDEWEEEEPGESLSHSEGEDEEPEENKEDDDEEDEDGFFVPHGYLSEGEGCEDDEDEDNTPERMKARQLAKAKAFEAEMKQKTQALRAFFIGCLWWTPEGSTDPNFKKLAEFTAVSLCPSGAIDVSLSKSAKANDTSPSVSGKTKTPKENGETRGAVTKPVPDEAMPDLVRLVHGNRFSIQKLIREFREYWSRKSPKQENSDQGSNEGLDISQDNMEAMNTSLNTTLEGNTSVCTPGTSDGKKCAFSKRQLDITIRSIANYTKMDGYQFRCWCVNMETLKKHNLADLPVPTKWVWLTRNNVKRLEEDLPPPNTPSGRDTPTQTSTPAANPITKFTVPQSQIPSPQVDQGTPKPQDTKNGVTPNRKGNLRDRIQSVTPKNLMSIKSAFAAIPKTKPNVHDGDVQNTKGEEKSDSMEDIEDCKMLTDEEISDDRGKKKNPNPDNAVGGDECPIVIEDDSLSGQEQISSSSS